MLMQLCDCKEKEAKEKVAGLRKKNFDKFCPLLKTNCNHQCVCFEKASMIAVARSNMPTPPLYEIYPDRCTNSMFFSKSIN
ncbi:hypothetical protein LCGC14_0653210 [marine sediment metagenome]|uniref:Uncharacterized protein n=1 Tax=marine sediment metagenome TaxID=412755 RepID=A0A0F9R0V6_9ZZZZ